MTEAIDCQPLFTVKKTASNGRLAAFSFAHTIPAPFHIIQTPFLFPVSYLMTGTTARGGATWKYILQDQEPEIKPLTLMRRNSPLLSQVLHFLDYRVSLNGVETWRRETIKGLYNKQHKGLNYQAPLFLDSGGFKLMFRTGLDLTRFGISLEEGEEARSILQLQRDLGGDMVATLDYPLPPNLAPAEAKTRMARSRRNAIETGMLLQQDEEFRDYNPFLYMAVHGLTPEAITGYIESLFESIHNEQLTEMNFGLAIGSLVPLRKGFQENELMVNIIRAAVNAVPEKFKNRVPFHVFGVTGLMVPFLAYLGIDTFDSSTFAQEARSLKYILPNTFERQNILEMSPNDIQCSCFVCQNMNLKELQESLVSEVKGVPQASGYFKSKYYADIALHNFELDNDILQRTRCAIEADALDDYLIEISQKSPRMRDALTAVAAHDESLKIKASQYILTVPQRAKFVKETPAKYITLTHKPEDFDINANGYRPTGDKKILLIIPCSREKPYSSSHTHKFLSTHLEEAIPDWQSKIDKVTLSGLYGPVPVAYETKPPVLEYEFSLVGNNLAQIELCTNRLVQFLQRHGHCYDQCIAYGTSNAYRTVFEKTAKRYERLTVFPEKPKSRRLNEFFRTKNISELIEHTKRCLNTSTNIGQD